MPDRTKGSYTIAEFKAAIERLRKPTPESDKLPLPAGHSSFKSQWLGWLDEYLGPGYYDRQNVHDSAQWAYQHLNNGNMIVWLNEAAGEDRRVIEAAIVAIKGRDSRQTEAMYAREILPWAALAERLFKR